VAIWEEEGPGMAWEEVASSEAMMGSVMGDEELVDV
jgi:hypothetical protein